MATRIDIPQSAVLDKAGRLQREWQQFFLLVAASAASAGTGTVTNAADLTAGQVVIGGGGNAILSLAAGTDTYVLTMVAGVPTWAIGGAAGSGTVTHTTGALVNHAVTIGSGVSVDDIKSLAAMTDGQIVVGITGADPAPVSVSGDGTLSSAGALTVNGLASLTHRIFGGI